MKFNFMSVIANILIVIFFILAFRVLLDKRIPYVSGKRMEFIALLVFGVIICAIGMLRNTAPRNFSEPFNFIAAILGVLAVGVAILALANIKNPIITGFKSATIALMAIVLIKGLIVIIHDLSDGNFKFFS